MARVWIYDRENEAEYLEQVEKAKAAKRKPPGRWQVRYYNPAGNFKKETYAKKPQAEERQTKLADQLAGGTYRDPAAAKVTFAEIAEKWLASRTKIKQSTWWRYRGVMDKHILPRWGDLPLSAINTEDIAVWVAELQKPVDKGGAGVGAAQVHQAHGVLSMVLEWCVPNRLARNPAKGVELPDRPQAEHVYLSYDEVLVLAEAMASRRTKYGQVPAAARVNRALVLLLAYTGLRWSEAAALRVGKVDLANRRIRVVVTFSEVNGEVIEQLPKNGEHRTVPIPASLVPELKPLVKGKAPGDLLFTTTRGNMLRIRNWRNREFKKAVKDAGFGDKGLTPHKLRHTAASLAIAGGADIKVIQTMLGHKTATMTLDIYGHLFPDRLDEVADAMDAGHRAAQRRAEEKAAKGKRLVAV